MILAVEVAVGLEAILNAGATVIAPWTAESPDRGVGLGPGNMMLRQEAGPDDPPAAKALIPHANHHRLVSRLPIKLHMLIPYHHHLTLLIHNMVLLGPTSLLRLRNIPVGHPRSRPWPFHHLVLVSILSILQPFLLLSLVLCLHLHLHHLVVLYLLDSIISLLPILVGSMVPGALLAAETGDRRLI